MKKRIIETNIIMISALLAVISATPFAYSEPLKNDYGKMYFVDFEYSNGNLKMLGYDLLSGYYPEKNPDGSYRIQLFSEENKLIYMDYFDIPAEVITFSDEGSSITELDSVNFTVALPYYESAKRIEISDNSKVLMDFPLPDLNEMNKNKGDYRNDSKWFLSVIIIFILMIILAVLILIIKKKNK